MSLLSVLIPARKEGERLWSTLDSLYIVLNAEKIPHEFVIVNDVELSEVGLEKKSLEDRASRGISMQYIERVPPDHGFGSAIRAGLAAFSGEAVVIVMADGCEAPEDVVRFYRKFLAGYDCVFGDRFTEKDLAFSYSGKKRFWNRLANLFLSFLFWLPYRDFTNAFKLYSKKSIQALCPIFSEHYNVTVELPLKAYVRGLKIGVIPNEWRGDPTRAVNLRLGKMGPRYLKTAVLVWLERWGFVSADHEW